MLLQIHKQTLEIVRAHGGCMSMLQLSHELSRQRMLGFGVDAADVVVDLVRDQRLSFDPDTDTVCLKGDR